MLAVGEHHPAVGRLQDHGRRRIRRGFGERRPLLAQRLDRLAQEEADQFSRRFGVIRGRTFGSAVKRILVGVALSIFVSADSASSKYSLPSPFRVRESVVDEPVNLGVVFLSFHPHQLAVVQPTELVLNRARRLVKQDLQVGVPGLALSKGREHQSKQEKGRRGVTLAAPRFARWMHKNARRQAALRRSRLFVGACSCAFNAGRRPARRRCSLLHFSLSSLLLLTLFSLFIFPSSSLTSTKGFSVFIVSSSVYSRNRPGHVDRLQCDPDGFRAS